VTRRLLTRARVIAFLPLLLMLGLPLRAHALARPGGGHGYSGGGSHSSGSSRSSSSRSSARSSSRDDDSSGDGGAMAELLVVLATNAFRATRDFPLVMWPIWGLVVVGVLLKMRSAAAAGPDWTTISASRESTPNVLPRVALEALREVDPDFSLVLFEDFVSALFARAHEARGQGRVADLGAWLSPSAQRSLNGLSRELASVDGILVGSMSYVSVRGITPPEERVLVEIEIDGNYTEHYEPHGRAKTSAFWTRERWILSRSRDARTPPPQSNQLRSFGCPTCGAPLTSRSPGVCSHCGRKIEPADFDWLVDAIQARDRQRTPPALTGDTQESGTDLETIVDPRAQARCQEIGARDPGFTWPAFQARVRYIFTELQPAWSTLDLRRARPYLSDRLFQTWSFWMDAYRREGLTNISDQARITEIALVRVVSDRSFDAITVRMWATGLDYTVDATGELRGGSRDTPREYSEYWTLIRGRGAAGPPRTDNTCPQCGAAMAVNMGGDCEHCGAHITAGEFDWVLSRVEQDEAYQG
jgi:Tim44-like domain